MWKLKSSSVGALVMLSAHKSFPALADKWIWWPAYVFSIFLSHDCPCWSPRASLLLPPSEPAGLRERICQWLGELANWLWVVCRLRGPLLPPFIACRNGPLYYLNPWLFGDCWALPRPGDNSLVLYSVLLPFKFEVWWEQSVAVLEIARKWSQPGASVEM